MKKSIYSIFAILMVITVISIGFSSCSVVDSGEAGIRFKKFSLTDQGKLDAVKATGFVFYNPFTESVYTYPAYVQRVDYPEYKVPTKGGTQFTVDPVLAYQLKRDSVVTIFEKYRAPLSQIETGIFHTYVKNACLMVASSYTPDELTENIPRFNIEVQTLLDSILGNEGFYVTEFTSNAVPPAELQRSIDAKNQAVQESLRAQNEVQKARANAEIAIAKAEGDAKAMKIKADAEAYYNYKISSSLTYNIVLEDWIEKWDGKLPQMQGSSNMVPMVNFNK
jgi:regulator of protease activity HflC (stomatin/prohibitin superfamily)